MLHPQQGGTMAEEEIIEEDDEAFGITDRVMMRVVDMLYSVPFIFVVIFLITLVGEYRTLLEDRYGIDRW